MTYLSALVPLIEDAYTDLFKNAAALKDNLDFKAAPTCRTPLEILNECVTVPAFLTATIASQALAPMDDQTWERADLNSLEACIAEWEKAKAPFLDAIANFPEAKLMENIETPWGTFSWRDFIAYAYWNPMWHAGQLAYIQTINGDTEMHF